MKEAARELTGDSLVIFAYIKNTNKMLIALSDAYNQVKWLSKNDTAVRFFLFEISLLARVV